MKTKTLAVVAAIALMAAGAAQAKTYTLEELVLNCANCVSLDGAPVPNVTVSGDLTTDGTFGSLNTENFTGLTFLAKDGSGLNVINFAWNLAISGLPSTPFFIFRELFDDITVSATDTDLTVSFPDIAGQSATFGFNFGDAGSFEFVRGSVIGSLGTPSGFFSSTLSATNSFTFATAQTTGTAPQPSVIPLPASAVLLLGALGGMGLLRRRQARA